MKKLNLIKPDVKTGYLEFGKGQEVKYLEINPEINRKELKSDITNGAVQFKEVDKYLDKKPSRFNIIYCSREEDGLMALSYLSSVYNRMEKLDPNMYGDDAALEDNQNFEFIDFDDCDINFGDDVDVFDEDDGYGKWSETPWKIPILSSDQIAADNSNPFNSFSIGGARFGGIINNKDKVPYWYHLRKESICVVHKMSDSYGAPPVSFVAHSLKRYTNNRHVYLVVVIDQEDMNSDDERMKWVRGEFCEIVLDYVAGTLNISATEEDYKKYYRNVFENQITKKGYSLKKGFAVDKIADSIIQMNNPDKACLMEKVVLYTTKDMKEPCELKESDFDILKQFETLGLTMADSKHKNIEKMKNELVGMENVKEQITSIIEVLKYNKRRAKMGLPTGSYHNVHMMIGAPGTAKTTVAELLGNMMAEEHLLRGNRFISVNGAELKGMYVGHSAPKVKALFDEHDIIFIDEAYAICAGSDGQTDSFSQEAIAQLIVELEKHGMDRLVMFAGYGGNTVTTKDNKMKEFLNANPGIRSRINSTIFFDSYSPEEMVKIFRCHAKIGKYSLSKKVDEIVKDYFEGRVKSADFGNGREARSLLENSMTQAAMRLAKLPEDEITEKMMQEIKVEDVEAAIRKMSGGTKMQNGRTSNRIGFVS